MKAIETAYLISWSRAVGMLYTKKKRLYNDPISKKILSPSYKFKLTLIHVPLIFNCYMRYKEKYTRGKMAIRFCRFRYIDDLLKNCIAKKEIETVVNFGSGMDPRPYYISGAENVRFFELDHPDVIKKKKAKIKKLLGKLPSHVIYVPIDFEKQTVDIELEKAGYNLNSKTLFIWEGVTYYLSREAINTTLKYVSKATTGSKIVFTYLLKDFIEGKNIPDGWELVYNYNLKKNNIFKFGLNQADVSNYLSKYSLNVVEDIGHEEFKDRYMKFVDLNLEVSELERIVLAEVN